MQPGVGLGGEPGDTGQDGAAAPHHGRAAGTSPSSTQPAIHSVAYAYTQTHPVVCQIRDTAADGDGIVYPGGSDTRACYSLVCGITKYLGFW